MTVNITLDCKVLGEWHVVFPERSEMEIAIVQLDSLILAITRIPITRNRDDEVFR